jgi:hypothetical protein
MARKADVSKILKAIKNEKKVDGINEKLTKALVNPMFRERNMMQEAMDMGSHGASEYFGKGKKK